MKRVMAFIGAAALAGVVSAQTSGASTGTRDDAQEYMNLLLQIDAHQERRDHEQQLQNLRQEEARHQQAAESRLQNQLLQQQLEQQTQLQLQLRRLQQQQREQPQQIIIQQEFQQMPNPNACIQDGGGISCPYYPNTGAKPFKF